MAFQLTSTRDQEQARADTIKKYWADRGFEVRTSVVPLGESLNQDTDGNPQYRGYQVQSNMRDGLPIALWESLNPDA